MITIRKKDHVFEAAARQASMIPWQQYLRFLLRQYVLGFSQYYVGMKLKTAGGYSNKKTLLKPVSSGLSLHTPFLP